MGIGHHDAASILSRGPSKDPLLPGIHGRTARSPSSVATSARLSTISQRLWRSVKMLRFSTIAEGCSSRGGNGKRRLMTIRGRWSWMAVTERRSIGDTSGAAKH
jgi:hypothetical protein